MTAAFVTYFDQRYVARAVVMLRSLSYYSDHAPIFALCFDDISENIIKGLDIPRITVISHSEILDFEPRLRACRGRSRWAFYATHKPALPRYVLARWPSISRVTHVDADARFYSSPWPIFEEDTEAAIYVCPHRFESKNAHLKNSFGAFNAGFISWRNCAVGNACLSDYMDDCINKVDEEAAGGHYMNQGYLTNWPLRYPGVHVIEHLGANVAYWNAATYPLTVSEKEGFTRVLVGGQPLIFFHFSAMFRDGGGRWRTNHLEFGDSNLSIALAHLYEPYCREVDIEFDKLMKNHITTSSVELPGNLDTFFYLT